MAASQAQISMTAEQLLLENERLRAELAETRDRAGRFERELGLKQLQVTALLSITQAINTNVKADGLFKMFRDFLSWEMSVGRMALFFKSKNAWECVSSLGFEDEEVEIDFADRLEEMKTATKMGGDAHPFLGKFDLAIPVLHKKEPLACVFIDGLDEREDIYAKVQFITTIINIVAVAIENKRLAKSEQRQVVLNREVEVASEIQQSLVPKSLPKGRHYQLSSIYKPHLAVGGDYYDFIEFPDGKFAFCVADISGKGVGAALLMANFQASLHALIYRYKSPETGFLALKELTLELNRAVFRITEGDRFVTFFIAEFCTRTRRLSWVNAGHVPPLVLETSGEVRQLEAGSTVVGAFDELPFIESGQLELPGEALIFSFTDGITDVRNDDGDEFSEAKLMAFVRSHAHLGVNVFNDKLLAVLEAFRGKQPLPDDVTVLTCKIAGAV